jgi:hypothetical protein
VLLLFLQSGGQKGIIIIYAINVLFLRKVVN